MFYCSHVLEFDEYHVPGTWYHMRVRGTGVFVFFVALRFYRYYRRRVQLCAVRVDVFSSSQLPGIIFAVFSFPHFPRILILIVVTQPRGHTAAGSLPPSPLRFVPYFLSR